MLLSVIHPPSWTYDQYRSITRSLCQNAPRSDASHESLSFFLFHLLGRAFRTVLSPDASCMVPFAQKLYTNRSVFFIIYPLGRTMCIFSSLDVSPRMQFAHTRHINCSLFSSSALSNVPCVQFHLLMPLPGHLSLRAVTRFAPLCYSSTLQDLPLDAVRRLAHQL